jgi:uncharacterized membrane protein YraQ (UPF0718 family)
VALGLRKNGSSVGASLAYWLGNPSLNPATLVFMGFVLGWQWVGLRLVVGVLLVFLVAYIVGRFADPETVSPALLLTETSGSEVGGSIWIDWLTSLWRLSKGLIPEYVVLVCLLGAARAWLFPAVTPSVDGLAWTLILAFTGTLFVIPTAGEIPIVQTLMAFGLGVGPAAALLITLPALSLPSLLMLYRSIPLKALGMTWFAVLFVGIISGGAATLLGF